MFRNDRLVFNTQREQDQVKVEMLMTIIEVLKENNDAQSVHLLTKYQDKINIIQSNYNDLAPASFVDMD